VVQGHVAEFVLSTGKAYHAAHPAEGFSAWCSTKLDFEVVIIVGVLAPVLNKEDKMVC
jgi:hypothetical protein